MATTWLEPDGVLVPESSLTLRRARELVLALKSPGCGFASLVECRATEQSESIVFDVEVERPQILANDIQRHERIAAVFRKDDAGYPEALALRPEFPHTPHLMVRDQEFPRSLCLYDQQWPDVRLTWTAPAFIERIRWWLTKTARGELHGDDQPLEPLMFGSGAWLVIPAGMEWLTKAVQWGVQLPDDPTGRVLVASKVDEKGRGPGAAYVAIGFSTPPHTHGVIRRTPHTLADLGALLKTTTFDLLTELRMRLRSWPADQTLQRRMIFVVALPKIRRDGGAVETVELKGFMTSDALLQVGADIGAWTVDGSKRGMLLPADTTRIGAKTKILVVNVAEWLTQEQAATLNGLEDAVTSKVVAVGLGALGSQVVMNLARAGFGQWTLIDDDDVLPHNLARHALDGFAVGFPKAKAMVFEINSVTNDDGAAHPIVANVLTEPQHQEEIASRLREAELVLDMSASVAVARHLALTDSGARRASLFVSPSGRDLVLLAEDRRRFHRLDLLEMQYYAATALDDRLAGHLAASGARIRYGQSCRDVSSRIPQHLLAMHAGIGAGAVRTASMTDGASIRIWRCDPETLTVSVIQLDPEQWLEQSHGKWRVYVSPYVLRRVDKLRQTKLPNETGGILLGSFDLDRRIAYLVEALPSPPDSDEWPQSYVRGCQGLRAELEAVQDRTAGNLGYCGEWHSHPDGAETRPSYADRRVFQWIVENMQPEGKPPVMLIAGEGGRARLFVDDLNAGLSEFSCPQ